MKIETETLLLLGAVGVITLAAIYAARQASSAIGAVGSAAASVGNAINPLNNDNVFASAINSVGGAVATSNGYNADGSWTLGGWLYDTTHPATVAAVNNITAPVNTGGATGSW